MVRLQTFVRPCVRGSLLQTAWCGALAVALWAGETALAQAEGPSTSSAPNPERLCGVHFNPVSESPPGTGHWLADYHIIRDRVNREVADLVATASLNFLDVMVTLPITLREQAQPPAEDATEIRQ